MKKAVVVIDNYDSFTYNLVQYLGQLGEEVRTYRNDAITLGEIFPCIIDLALTIFPPKADPMA